MSLFFFRLLFLKKVEESRVSNMITNNRFESQPSFEASKFLSSFFPTGSPVPTLERNIFNFSLPFSTLFFPCCKRIREEKKERDREKTDSVSNQIPHGWYGGKKRTFGQFTNRVFFSDPCVGWVSPITMSKSRYHTYPSHFFCFVFER